MVAHDVKQRQPGAETHKGFSCMCIWAWNRRSCYARGAYHCPEVGQSREEDNGVCQRHESILCAGRGYAMGQGMGGPVCWF